MDNKYDQIHAALATQYKTVPEVINYIRSCYGGLHLSRQAMIVRNDKKIAAMSGELQRVIHHIAQPVTTISRSERYANLLTRRSIIQKKLNERLVIVGFLTSISDHQFSAIVHGIEEPS